MTTGLDRAIRALEEVYPAAAVAATCDQLVARLAAFDRTSCVAGCRAQPDLAGPRRGGLRQLWLNHRDALLITYPDQVRRADEPPLRTLSRFLCAWAADLFSIVHVLPFYPASSDDGFAVVDQQSVDPAFGDWEDLARLGKRFHMMFDLVLNHVSAQSSWFGRFIADQPAFRDRFVIVGSEDDLGAVVRPRTTPLTTTFPTATGPIRVWTTFGPDQVDLNYRDPRVLWDVVDWLLLAVKYGASALRLDAVAYLWKEPGTGCINLPQAHALVRFLRGVLDEVAPDVLLVAEANVEHRANLDYLGDGHCEAQLIYNFALPPLVLHSLSAGNGWALSNWAAGLAPPSEGATYLNFLASHDGIGLNAARGLLAPAEIEALVAALPPGRGFLSARRMGDGQEQPYELNVNFLDALWPRSDADEPHAAVARFAVAHAIALAVVGVPGIYFHSLVGSRGWPEGVSRTGRARTVNREKLDHDRLTAELRAVAHLRHQVYGALAALLRARASCPAFDPCGSQEVLDCGPGIFALLRTDRWRTARAVCLHNLTGRRASVRLGAWALEGGPGRDLVTGRTVSLERGGRLALSPYQTIWCVKAG